MKYSQDTGKKQGTSNPGSLLKKAEHLIKKL
jgi:hypothetical protein